MTDQREVLLQLLPLDCSSRTRTPRRSPAPGKSASEAQPKSSRSPAEVQGANFALGGVPAPLAIKGKSGDYQVLVGTWLNSSGARLRRSSQPAELCTNGARSAGKMHKSAPHSPQPKGAVHSSGYQWSKSCLGRWRPARYVGPRSTAALRPSPKEVAQMAGADSQAPTRGSPAQSR